MWIKTTAVAAAIGMALAMGSVTLQKASSASSELPAPRKDGSVSVEAALEQRRSVRAYSEDPVALDVLAQLLWAGQGITGAEGKRTSPSAGARYPLELYVVAGNAGELTPGVYHYLPESHRLTQVNDEDVREALAGAALGQDPVRQAPAVLVIAGVYKRTTSRYGDRGIRYVHMEAGHVGQNIYLQAEACGVRAVSIGAFDDNAVQRVLGLPKNNVPLYLIPIGLPR
ncbi:MAG: SagB/ThcOx family dehydrogenase [Candidatus Hydrogenedentota bacterium]